MRHEGFVDFEAESVEAALAEASKKTGIPASKIKYEVLASRQYGPSSRKKRYVKIRVLKGERLAEETPERKILELLDAAQNFARTRDGYFLITIAGENVELTVFQHQGDGRPVSAKDIMKKLEDQKYVGVDGAAVRAALDPCNNEKTLIVASLNPAFRDVDAAPVIDISDDRMNLYLKFLPPHGKGRYPKVGAVIETIRKMGVTASIDVEAIENLIANKISDSRILAASGKQPVAGEDTRVKWEVERLAPEKVIYYRPDGSVDFRRIYELSNVRTGQKIGAIEKAGPGTPGENLFGFEIPAKHGADKPVTLGQDIGVDGDGVTVTARIDGQIKIVDGVPCIARIFEIPGDVNFSVGSIDFNGSVVVSGGVMDGFSIRAGGNIYVEKTVGEATLEAEGDIYLASGFLGKNRGLLNAQKNVLIKFAEGGAILARGSVTAVSAIIHSRVVAGERIEVLGKRGQIVGGDFLARDEIVARAIGAPMGITTKLSVGFDTLLQEDYEKVKSDLQATEKEIEKVNQLHTYLTSSKSRDDRKIRGDIGAMMDRAEKTREMLEAKRKFLLAEREKLFRDIQEGPRGEVSALDVIRSGVTVNIKNVIYQVKSDIKASKLHLDEDGEVRIYPL